MDNATTIGKAAQAKERVRQITDTYMECIRTFAGIDPESSEGQALRKTHEAGLSWIVREAEAETSVTTSLRKWVAEVRETVTNLWRVEIEADTEEDAEEAARCDYDDGECYDEDTDIEIESIEEVKADELQPVA